MNLDGPQWPFIMVAAAPVLCACLMFTLKGYKLRIRPPMQPCILMLVSAALNVDRDSSCDDVQARP